MALVHNEWVFFSLNISFRHLSCVPKKGDPKKGTRRKSFPACSVVLGTFRKLADRILPHFP